MAIVGQVGKDARVERMQAGDGGLNGVRNGDQPATNKQIGYLNALNVEIPEGLTKHEASELIDQNSQPA